MLPHVIVAPPTLVFPLVRRFNYARPQVGSFDNLFAISVDEPSYVAAPGSQVDAGANRRPRTRAAIRII